MWKDSGVVKEEVLTDFLKRLLDSVPDDSDLAVDGFEYGFVSDNIVKDYFNKANFSWIYPNKVEPNFYTILTSSKKRELISLLDIEVNLVYEFLHFYIKYKEKVIFESYDRFSLNWFNEDLLSKDDLNYFRSKGMSMTVNTK